MAPAQELREIRVNAETEKDVGFAPRQAQSATKSSASLLETPRAVSVVTREQVESRQAATLQQALQTVPGVSPVNFGRRGFDDLNIRGFRSTESILIDGLVQSPGMWTRLQPYGYERFEVLKGASSVLYGQVQPGGIVNAVSKRPRKEPLGEVGAEVGSFGQRSLFADLNRPLSASGKTALRVNALVSDGDDPTDFVFRKDQWLAPSLSLDLGDSTDLVLFATYLRARWLRQQGVTPVGTLLPNPNGPIPVTRYTGEPSFGNYDIEQTTFGWALEHRFSPRLTLRQGVRHERETGDGRFVANGTLQANRRLQNRSASLQRMDYDIWVSDTALTGRFDTGTVKHELTVGLDARTGNSLLASTSCTVGALDLYAPVYGTRVTCPAAPTTNAPSKLTVAGVYLQDQVRLGNGFSVLLGVRHDRAKNETDDRIRNRRTVQRDDATVGSAGLVYEFLPGWSAYASYSESFLPVSGQTFGGQPFEPETGQQPEVGLKVEGRGMTGSLALYRLTRQNVTTADPVNTGFSVQTGEQRSQGLEAEVGVDLARGLKLVGAYAYTEAKVTRDNNRAIVGLPINLTPRHVFALWTNWKLPVEQRLTLGAGLRHVSDQEGALPFTLPSYTVVDASVTWTASQWRVTAGVKNLFDRAYFDGAINANVVSPALPRTFTLTASVLF